VKTTTTKSRKKKKTVKAARIDIPLDLHGDLVRLKIDRNDTLWNVMLDTMRAGVEAIRSQPVSA